MLVIGSWKIIEMRSPRTSRIARSPRSSKLRPSNSTAPDSMRPGGDATSRKIERAVTVLPQPLSPTRATVVPRGTSNDTPSTARTMRPSVRNVVTRSRTRRIGASSIAEAKAYHRCTRRRIVDGMRCAGALAIARSFVVAALHPLALTPALALAFASLAATGPLGCVRPLRMCTMSGDCGALSSCVAGRCVTHGAVPAIATAHRMLFEPVELGYVRRDRDGAREAPAAPAVATLGPGGGRVFMRFAVPIAPEVTIVEAYV